VRSTGLTDAPRRQLLHTGSQGGRDTCRGPCAGPWWARTAPWASVSLPGCTRSGGTDRHKRLNRTRLSDHWWRGERGCGIKGVHKAAARLLCTTSDAGAHGQWLQGHVVRSAWAQEQHGAWGARGGCQAHRGRRWSVRTRGSSSGCSPRAWWAAIPLTCTRLARLATRRWLAVHLLLEREELSRSRWDLDRYSGDIVGRRCSVSSPTAAAARWRAWHGEVTTRKDRLFGSACGHVWTSTAFKLSWARPRFLLSAGPGALAAQKYDAHAGTLHAFFPVTGAERANLQASAAYGQR